MPWSKNVRAIAFTAASVLITIVWTAAPGIVSFRRPDLWTWFVCCGVVLLSASRFSIRHPVPAPEVGLLSFPFLFELFFQKICPSRSIPALDQLLWNFDAIYGYPQPALSKMILWSPLTFWLFKLTWLALPLFFIVLYVALPADVRRRYLLALVCAGCLILPLYALCPGAGPGYLFGARYPAATPGKLLNPQPVFLRAGLLLNTTPSGHVAWALLLFWFARRYCRTRVAIGFAAILGLTVVATLGLGEHYVVDLVLSVPYAAAIWAIVERRWKRAAAFLGIVIVWLLLLRGGWALDVPAAAAWLATIVTLVSPVRWRRTSVPEVFGGSKASCFQSSSDGPSGHCRLNQSS